MLDTAGKSRSMIGVDIVEVCCVSIVLRWGDRRRWISDSPTRTGGSSRWGDSRLSEQRATDCEAAEMELNGLID